MGVLWGNCSVLCPDCTADAQSTRANTELSLTVSVFCANSGYSVVSHYSCVVAWIIVTLFHSPSRYKIIQPQALSWDFGDPPLLQTEGVSSPTWSVTWPSDYRGQCNFRRNNTCGGSACAGMVWPVTAMSRVDPGSHCPYGLGPRRQT